MNRMRGCLAIVPPYNITGPPAGLAYLLGALQAAGVNDIGFSDLRLATGVWPELTYRPAGIFNESFVIDVPDLPLVLHFLNRPFDGGIWQDLEALPWVRRYCATRGLPVRSVAASIRRTQKLAADWAASVDGIALAGFSTWTSNYLTTLMVASELKKLGNPPFVVLGGPQVSESEVAAELALASGLADAIVVGEGEQTFVELQALVDRASHTLNGALPPGVRVWRNGKVEAGGRRKLMRLEDLALPSFEAMDLDAYSTDGHRPISFQLSRGCTDKCEFCSEWVFLERFRSASPDYAVTSLKELQARTGFDKVHFSDSLLNGHPQRLTTFAECVLSTGLNFCWSGFARAAVDQPTAKLLARAGLESLFIGIESMSSRTLELMNKRREAADNLNALETFIESGIRVYAGIVAGFPGDSRADFLDTVDVLRELSARHPGMLKLSVEPFVLTPTSPMFSKRQALGLALIPWDSDVINLAPALAAIAQLCMCRVEGPEQSTERSGRLQYAHAAVMEESRQAGYRESLASVPLAHDWVLLYESQGGSRDGWILSEAEARSLSFGPLNRARVEALAEAAQLRWKLPLHPSAGGRGVNFEQVSRLGLHPGVIVRRCRRTRRLLVVDRETLSLHRMPAFAPQLVEYLSGGMRSRRQLQALAKKLRLSREALDKTLRTWWSKKLLSGTPVR